MYVWWTFWQYVSAYSFLHVNVSLPLQLCFSFGLQACVRNYKKNKKTNAVANNPPIYKNKGRQVLFWCNNKHSLFSQKNKDKYNEVTQSFLNYNLWLEYHTVYSGIFQPCHLLWLFHSCIFYPCCLFPHCPPLQFTRIAFSTPAFLVAPFKRTKESCIFHYTGKSTIIFTGGGRVTKMNQ